ncbi:MAG: glycosyltransferase [Rikenellaceae bacterium]
MKRKFVLIVPDNNKAYDFVQKLAVKLKSLLYEIYVITPNRDYAEALELLDIKVIEVPECENSSNILSKARYIFSLMRVFWQLKPNTVLGYTTKPAVYGAIAARLCGECSISALITSVDYLSYFNKIGLSAADNAIFLNYNDKCRFVQNELVDLEKTMVINNYSIDKGWSDRTFKTLLTAMGLIKTTTNTDIINYV